MPDIEEQDESSSELGGRPIWSGTVSFGLVSVPVNIVTASVARSVNLHMVSEEGQQLRRQYVRASDDEALTQDEIVRGYEVEKGQFVVVDDDELERIAPERTRDIDLRVFVDTASIDPMYFVKGYFLTPAANPKAYLLLARVMEEEGKAGIATFVMRAKEYVAAILAENGILRLETLRFADEIRSPTTVGLPAAGKAKPADVKKIEAMIERLTKAKLDMSDLEDHAAAKLTALAKRKAKAGEDVVAVPEDEEEQSSSSATVVDLMTRLRESLAANGTSVGAPTKRGASRKPPARRKRAAHA